MAAQNANDMRHHQHIFTETPNYIIFQNSVQFSLSLHRAHHRVTSSAHQPMHTLKLFTLKILKNAPTCFDHHQGAVCSLLKLHY